MRINKKIEISLDKKYKRPIIDLYGISTIIDTGAVIPTFSIAPFILERSFCGKKLIENISIGGFGGKSYGDLYSIENFKVGDINYSHLDVFVPYKPVTRHPFLLSATMFYGTNYSINTIDSKLIIEKNDAKLLNRDFRVRDLNGELYAQIDGVLLQDSIECEFSGTYNNNNEWSLEYE